MIKEEDKPKYKAVCCKCETIFYACKSIGQDMGIIDAGCGSCPKCETFLNLTFDEQSKEMKTTEWDKYLRERP